MNILSPSVLSADFAQLGEGLQAIASGGAKYIHLDVMDGHFVPNISFGIPVIASLRKEAEKLGLNLIFDTHLMIADPAKYIKDFANAGSDIITFHIEACESPDHAVQIAKNIHSLGKKAGIAINPHTSINAISSIAHIFDMALVMSVVPGFGGQGFIAETLEKTRYLRKNFPNLDIQMDGGISHENLQIVLDAGANIIVVGSAIFGKSDVTTETKSYVSAMRQI
ncbi:MAG: ribulose-phosphate 3-epimerase [Defluviitaleaceae bacterium]|nr:ribulose-phosphate 3-epimerase [Defluviitaleaceae bacterium]